MIDLDDALDVLVPAAPRLGHQAVGLDDAVGRVLAEDVATDRDEPATDRSAMDGFGVRAVDTCAAGATLRVVGEVAAGHAPTVRVGPGEAVRLFTGAVLPPGADAVVMVERTSEDRVAGTVRIEVAAETGQHVRPRGQDARAGEPALPAGTLLGAAEIAALAAVGHVTVRVARRPRVAVLSTGDEVLDAAAAPAPHQVRNSNAPMLRALARSAGGAVVDAGTARDERGALAEAVRRALGAADLLLLTGGVSVGEYDLVRETLEGLGATTLFHGVRIKPGKPVLAGRAGDTLVLGLPGNPVSAFCGFVLFGAPVLRLMQGRTSWRTARLAATLLEPLRRRPGRRTFSLALLDTTRDGASVRPVATTGSGDVLALGRANAFVETDEDSTGADAGTSVVVVPWIPNAV